MKYMIGVDIGTTSTKSVLYDEQGQFITKHNIGYPLHTPNVDVSEENRRIIRCRINDSQTCDS